VLISFVRGLSTAANAEEGQRDARKDGFVFSVEGDEMRGEEKGLHVCVLCSSSELA